MRHTFSYCAQDMELRPMTWEDSERYRQLRNQEKNRQRFFSSEPISEAAQRSWFQRYLEDPTDIMFSFYYRGIFAGGNAIYHINQETKSAEHGRILIDKQIVPMGGFGCASILGAAQIAQRKLGLTRLYAEIYTDNQPSLHAYRNAGFEQKQRRTLENGAEIYYMEKQL